MKQNIILLVIDWTKILHTESQYICLVDTETAKVPAIDLYKNSKSKNKNLPFFNYEKSLTTSLKNQNLSFVSREMGCDMNGTHY